MALNILTEQQSKLLISAVELSLDIRKIKFEDYLHELKELASQDIDIIFDAFIESEQGKLD